MQQPLKPPTDLFPALEAWLSSAQGQLLLSWEQQQLATIMPQVLGARLLQIGHWPLQLEELGASRILQCWCLSSHRDSAVQLHGEEARLPVASRSVDAVLLPHSLELARDPHAVLREVERVLSPRGQIIVLGLNPMSPWRLGSMLPPRRQTRFPHQARCYPLHRISDWLGLLDFEVDKLQRFGRVFPWGGDVSRYQGLRRCLVPLSQAYLIFARRRVVPVTPLRSRWQRMPRIGAAVLPEARVHRQAA